MLIAVFLLASIKFTIIYSYRRMSRTEIVRNLAVGAELRPAALCYKYQITFTETVSYKIVLFCNSINYSNENI